MDISTLQITEDDDAIRELAVIGDRRTAAVLDNQGSILWYCPGRFDRPSIFSGLLDPNGGSWTVDVVGGAPAWRRYLDESGALQTALRVDGKEWIATDFMPAGDGIPAGLICRRFSAAPVDLRIVLRPRPNYGRDPARLASNGEAVTINGDWCVYASQPLMIDGDAIYLVLPRGHEGWAVLANGPLPSCRAADLDVWLDTTLAHWRRLSATDPYVGPYEKEISASIRALRLLHHEETGGIVAAVTTSLPEVPGGSANWDYRYVWLRDAGMIVSALIRAGGGLAEGERFLDFICSSRGSSSKYPVPVFATLEQEKAPNETSLNLAGHRNSRPVRIGNAARDQMQLDGFANVLLAAKLVYQRTERRPHWETVAAIADFLVAHWQEPDHGIWEEPITRQYTVGKVIIACGLDSIAEFSPDQAQVRLWRSAVQDIRHFVAGHCMTTTGAYAVFAGSENVDVSAALFPIWGYTAADTLEMRRTMAALERNYSHDGLLYWRHLECSDSRKEGAFLAATFWIAQYWVMRGDLKRARAIIDAALVYSNDLGLFAEEADPRTGRMQGNIPQAFVHAAFIGAVIDLKSAEAADCK